MKIFISTGEVSGDLQGSLLVTALQKQSKIRQIPLEIRALGGEKMAQAGAILLGDTTSIGSVGVIESLPFILPTLQVQKQAKQYLRENPPDVLVLIDYIGPNLSIGNYVKKYCPQVPVVYYIAPQNWVWSPFPKSDSSLVNLVDRIFAVFPQEADYFQSKGAKVTWVGHPLLDRMENSPKREEMRAKFGLKNDQPVITLLPASRRQEIKYLLPLMAQSAYNIQQKIPDVHFLIPVSLPQFQERIQRVIDQYQLSATLLLNTNPLEAISAGDLAITKSGTVNLEIALLNVPQVVIYKVHPSTIFIARKFFNFSIPFMSAVNLMLMEEIVPELLQELATVENITTQSLDLLLNLERREKMKQDYTRMKNKLGMVGVVDRTANLLLDYANLNAH